MTWSIYAGWLIAAQIPAPAVDSVWELERSRLKILETESAALAGIADRLEEKGDRQGAAGVRAYLIQPAPVSGAGRFRILPAVEPRMAPARKDPWLTEVQAIRQRSIPGLRALAQRAAQAVPPRYSLACFCYRDILERDPNDAEARKLLGFVPYQNGWATPFAVKQLQAGMVDHPRYGWVQKDWVEHLDRGELPAPGHANTSKKATWLPAAQADELRAHWNPPWRISTEHFDIQTSVPLDQAIQFGRRLESFRQLFMCLMADVLGENAPLARRLRSSSASLPGGKPHRMSYYASREEYIEDLTPKLGEDIATTLGYYDPPRSGKSGRGVSYFFRDERGQLPVTATLYHEVSHQLLFENGGHSSYLKNDGNYWVFEGLGAYFETIEPRPDGSLEYGGLVGRRVEEACRSLLLKRQGVPFQEFVRYGRDRFNQRPAIYLHYQQAMVYVIYLMQADQGQRRSAFLDYVRDAYHGRIKRTTGRTLEDRVGESYGTIEAGCLAYLKAHGPCLAETDKDLQAPADQPGLGTIPVR